MVPGNFSLANSFESRVFAIKAGKAGVIPDDFAGWGDRNLQGARNDPDRMSMPVM